MSGNRSGYDEVDILRDPDGLCAVICRRRASDPPQYSVAIMKEFMRDEKSERTAFMQPRHIPAAHRLLTLAQERIDELEDKRLAEVRILNAKKTSAGVAS